MTRTGVEPRAEGRAEYRFTGWEPVPAPPAMAPAAESAPVRAVLRAALVLLGALFLLLVVRLPWAGDLGLHAATLERLRVDLTDPGNPMVAADTDSPYYSPWMVLLAVVAKATGLGTFVVLRVGSLVALALLATGVFRFTRTFTARRAAGPLALLCVLLLWGPLPVAWSGFPGLGSLAVTLAYPSTFTLGLAFHFWAFLTRAVRSGANGSAFLGLGLLWAVILLSHQFSGVVATIGALAVLLGARPWPVRETWLRIGAGLFIGLALLAGWPYYEFFDLFGIGGLEEVHRPIYRQPLPRLGFTLIGVAALGLRWRRDRRDPLVLFFLLGALMVAAGAATGHWSWGRALPAALIPAQLAAALAAVSGGTRLLRNLFAAVTGAALLAGAWAQSGTLGYVVREDAVPHGVREKIRQPWAAYHWITPWVEYGDTVMAQGKAARQIPAYGPYTVAPGYPDFFLPDERQRLSAVHRYFAEDARRADRLAALHAYDARWILWSPGYGGLAADDPALRRVATGPGGQVLYEVVG